MLQYLALAAIAGGTVWLWKELQKEGQNDDKATQHDLGGSGGGGSREQRRRRQDGHGKGGITDDGLDPSKVVLDAGDKSGDHNRRKSDPPSGDRHAEPLADGKGSNKVGADTQRVSPDKKRRAKSGTQAKGKTEVGNGRTTPQKDDAKADPGNGDGNDDAGNGGDGAGNGGSGSGDAKPA